MVLRHRGLCHHCGSALEGSNLLAADDTDPFGLFDDGYDEDGLSLPALISEEAGFDELFGEVAGAFQEAFVGEAWHPSTTITARRADGDDSPSVHSEADFDSGYHQARSASYRRENGIQTGDDINPDCPLFNDEDSADDCADDPECCSELSWRLEHDDTEESADEFWPSSASPRAEHVCRPGNNDDDEDDADDGYDDDEDDGDSAENDFADHLPSEDSDLSYGSV
eukprot:gnl/TRDRNA2_/TRDRNA2_163263_c1_seq1.p1 gnl/TRDRNA2_/TRDRNA2_163263_c1~~gnl/TRDRNA2_/TRDRNA2_163263_c1_seq1.p1  ORF type:complete len:225 (+),score=38.01 gnl/TRDRNA2_/TRDRNA2_163263_c1_seq1:94-768(+)